MKTSHSKQVEKDNKAFKKMNADRKRVAIARDVLKHLATKRFQATQRIYLLDKNAEEEIYAPSVDAQVCEVLKKVDKCSVCALGALFVATVEKANALTVSEFNNEENCGHDGSLLSSRTNISKYLSKYFDDE